MKEFHDDQNAFGQICGSCDGIDMDELTEEDIRQQAHMWAQQGDPCSDEMIEAAIRALHEMQNG